MKTRLLLVWATLALLLTACEEEEQAPPTPQFKVKIHVGMPTEYGRISSVQDLKHPVSEATVRLYRTKEDYLLDQNVLVEGLTDMTGIFIYPYDTAGSLWFRTHKDTLSNLREVRAVGLVGGVEVNEVVNERRESSTKHGWGYATLTNTPTKLRLLVYHNSQPIEGAQVQLYFTEQAYQDSLVAQEDSIYLRPTYGYRRIGASDSEKAFINRVKDNFLQITNEAGEVYFDNLEPRNYWFRIIKDTLSNEGNIIRTREALPRDAEVTTQMEVGVN